jgi:hypothetical protein
MTTFINKPQFQLQKSDLHPIKILIKTSPYLLQNSTQFNQTLDHPLNGELAIN